MKKKLLIVLGIFVIAIAAAFIVVADGLGEGSAVVLDGIDLSSVADGDYTGEYNFKRWSNKVVVHVENNRITAIETLDDVRASGITNCSSEVFNRVIAAQDTKVDAVSGATVTSKAYLKAIEDAVKH